MSIPVSKTREITVADVGRTFLNSAVLLVTSLLLLAVSCLAFLFFYHHNVPALGVQRIAHLQYHEGRNPHASVELIFSTSQLSTSQPYDIIVELTVPNSPSNHALGNFMVELDMIDTDSSSVVKAARPAILRYSSPLIDTVSTVLGSAPILLGFREESQILSIPVMERYVFESGWLTHPAQANLVLHAPDLRVYSCRILFQTRMQGLAWFLSTFKLTAFLLFTTGFWISSMVFMLATWLLISLVVFPATAATPSVTGRSGNRAPETAALGTPPSKTGRRIRSGDAGSRQSTTNPPSRSSQVLDFPGSLIKEEEEEEEFPSGSDIEIDTTNEQRIKHDRDEEEEEEEGEDRASLFFPTEQELRNVLAGPSSSTTTTTGSHHPSTSSNRSFFATRDRDDRGEREGSVDTAATTMDDDHRHVKVEDVPDSFA